MRVSILIAALILSFSSEANERHALELSFCSLNTNCSECAETVGVTLIKKDFKIELQAKALSGEDIRETLDKCEFVTADEFICDLGRAKIKRENGVFSMEQAERSESHSNDLAVCVREV